MRKIEDYRRHAAECRDMAQRANGQEQREMLLSMAATWDSLAAGREESLKRLQRIEKLDAMGISAEPQTDE
jgi:hypothetical protein